MATDKKRFFLNGNHNFIASDSVGAFDAGANCLNSKIAGGIIATKTSITCKSFASDSGDKRAGSASKRNSE